MNLLKKYYLHLFFIFILITGFNQLFIKQYLPIPSDTIIGLYHPFRDLYSQNYPNGIPYKNFLITDPVRQSYLWKELSIEKIKNAELPIWNPYSMAGMPLLANFQSSPFYIFNLLLFLNPFYLSWSVFIFIQPFLAGFFMYLYLKNRNLDTRAIFMSVLSFCFSGFFVSWLEWGNILHTAIWLPLILFSIDKIFSTQKTKWFFLYTFSLVSAFFAGHLQVFSYLFIFSFLYFIVLWVSNRNAKILFFYVLSLVSFACVTSVQWIPTLQFINLSARGFDQSLWTKPGWFVPLQNFVQLLVPDFFGNPTTLNYWGVWNYGELVSYIGVVPLIFSVIGMFLIKRKIILFYFVFMLVSILFSTNNPISQQIYLLGVPFISTSQPTRLIFIITFCLSVLSAFGFDYFIKNSGKKIVTLSFATLAITYLFICFFVFFASSFFTPENIIVTKSNLLFPNFIFIISTILFLIFRVNNKLLKNIVIIGFLMIAIFDLLRFFWKFEPFTSKQYLFPSTRSLDYLKTRSGIFRISTTDSRIMPPNFSVHYKLQALEGYDPLYLLTFANLITAMERGTSVFDSPIPFNRIITVSNFNNQTLNLLNIKYVLSFNDMGENYSLVYQEGQTKIYENKNVIPRAFLVNKVFCNKNEKKQLDFILKNDVKNNAIIEDDCQTKNFKNGGSIEIISYKENNIEIKADVANESFVVLTDVYYPTWKASVDGVEVKVYKTDYAFRGLFLPKGKHDIKFYISLF